MYTTASQQTPALPATMKLRTREPSANRYRTAYYWAFLIALVLCWSPFKSLAYFSPWIALGVFLGLTRSEVTLRNLLLFIVVWMAVLPFYALLTPKFALHSAILWLLTYGTFIFVLVIPSKPLADLHLRDRMLQIVRWLVLFQGTFGIFQAVANFRRIGTFDGSAGDVVAGTIRPFAVTPDFSNPMFALNMALLLVFMFPSLVVERKGRLAFGIGIVALILASVLHLLLFLAGAIVLAFLIYYPAFFLRKSGCIILITGVLVSLFAGTLLSSNFSTLSNFARYTLEGRTIRAQVVTEMFTEVPSAYPWQPALGFGPGQFNSRAGLIGTGLYFGSPDNPRTIPFLPQGMSQPFREYILERWLSTARDGVNNSSTAQPYFSWLSVYAEGGMFGVGTIIVVVFRILFKLRRYSRRLPAHNRLEILALAASIMLLFFLGFQENYWEVSQAIFVGLILLKLQYAIFSESWLLHQHSS